MKTLASLLLSGLLLTPVFSASASPLPPLPDLTTVTKQLDTLYRAKSAQATISMEVNTAHFSRSLTMDSWSIGEERMLMVIRKPAREAGTATLKTEKGLWNYAPRADRLLRIPSGMLSESWMGSHFTNDDLMQESTYSKDYTSKLAWVEEKGQRLLQLTTIPKPDTAIVYSRIVQVMTEGDWLPLRADYYDGDEVIRTMHFRERKTLDGRLIPTVMELIPTDKPKESTRITYQKLDFDVEIPAKRFTPRGLRQAAQQR